MMEDPLVPVLGDHAEVETPSLLELFWPGR